MLFFYTLYTKRIVLKFLDKNQVMKAKKVKLFKSVYNY
jgi:hypothetical protein